MKFHHMAIFVSDMDAALKLWRDLFGFTIRVDTIIPDGDEAGPNAYFSPALLDDIFGAKGSRSRMVILASPEGAVIELQQCEVPRLEKTPPEKLGYRQTGILELALEVENIDGWFEKIRAAGYSTQTEYVWPCANILRSFLFFDQDGNLIQLCEPMSANRPAPPIQG